MAGFQFKKNNFTIEVEGIKYESTLSMTGIADIFTDVSKEASQYENTSKNFKDESKKIVGLIKGFVDEVFGENSFDKMTEALDAFEMDMALQLFEYITVEFNEQKINSVVNKYSPNRAKRRSNKK